MTDGRPTKWAIVQYWASSPSGHEAFAPSLSIKDPCCFACGWFSERWTKATPRSSWERAALERAHIVPRSLGGNDAPSNLILLCAPCHRESPDWHDPQAMADWIAVRPERSSKEVEDLSDWCTALNQVPEFRLLLADLEALPGLPNEEATERMVDMLWASTLKAGFHAGALSSGTKVAIVRSATTQAMRAGLAMP
ncbi:HNH endonuclease signature motif containing protein [Streptomyces sp. NPDC056682]|uniref:HNH endonuclease signature motif containing protein n=1 Tax=Streptomyces sp. NPDC056682 TaxID=3345909 RepID=UPI00368EAE3A